MARRKTSGHAATGPTGSATANTAAGGAAAARFGGEAGAEQQSERSRPSRSATAPRKPEALPRLSCVEAEAEQQSERNSAAEARGAAFLQLLRALARRGVRRCQAGGHSEARAVHLNHKKRLPAKNSKLMKKGRRFKLQFNIILIILKFGDCGKFLPQGAVLSKNFAKFAVKYF